MLFCKIESGALSESSDLLKPTYISVAYAHTSTQRKANDGRQGNIRKTNFLSLTLGFFCFYFNFSYFSLSFSFTRLCTSFQGQFFIFVILSLSLSQAYASWYSFSSFCVHKMHLCSRCRQICGGEKCFSLKATVNYFLKVEI